jgi:hypothetical protein
MSIYTAEGQLVHRIASPAGETRSAGSTLLLPGQYIVQIAPLLLPGQAFVASSYEVQGRAVSNPLAVDPVDPSDLEYACPDLPGWYCYPGGVISETPYLWEDFLGTLPLDPTLDPSEQISTLLGDWWRWYWQRMGENGPPLTTNDTYDVPVRSSLQVDASNGVLANDSDPEASWLSSLLLDLPRYGAVQLELDGSFTYTPSPNFVGMDHFSYEAIDALGDSSFGDVTVRVGSAVVERADFSGDGVVDEIDIQQLAVGLRANAGPQFDLNLDSTLDAEDWRVMIYDVMQTSFGDANLDGTFDSNDMVQTFQAGEYEDAIAGNSTWKEGDWNGDGDFDTNDFVLAFQTGLYERPSALNFRRIAAAVDWLFAQSDSGGKGGVRGRS